MIRFLDALEIDRSMLWGHSDGATIAAWMAIEAPQRFGGVILEALHFYRCKPVSSADLLAELAENPDMIGERLAALLATEHGEDHWRDLIVANSRAWLRDRRGRARIPRPISSTAGCRSCAFRR